MAGLSSGRVVAAGVEQGSADLRLPIQAVVWLER